MKSKAEWLKFKLGGIQTYHSSAEFASHRADNDREDLIEWLAMEGSEAYADAALFELGPEEGIFNILRQGQLLELMDLWDEIYK